MIKKLRWQFIISASIAVLIVLTTIISIINTAIYNQTNDRMNARLDYIIENNGNLPKNKENYSSDSDLIVTPETAYETRYFIIRMNADGTIKNADLSQIASISERQAKRYAKTVFDKEQGTIKRGEMTYYYKVKTQKNNEKIIAFIDGTSSVVFNNNILHLSIWIGLVSFIFFFGLVFLFSKQAIKPIIRSQLQQKQFITNAGHELKTPLAVISANTEVLEMLNGKNEWTQSTMKQVKRLSGLVGELVTIARLDEREDIVSENFDYSETVRTVTEDFKSVAASNDLTLESEIADHIMVKGDQKTLHELVNILIDNAIKYCDEGGLVKVSLTKGRKVRLAVSNNYKDGKDVDYTRFFERFYREDKAHTNNAKSGYGIGLSMAESIVKAAGGKINVSWKDDIITFEVLL